MPNPSLPPFESEPEYSRPTTAEECIERAVTAMVESEKTANAGATAITYAGLAIAHGWVAVARGMSGLPTLLETAQEFHITGELTEHVPDADPEGPLSQEAQEMLAGSVRVQPPLPPWGGLVPEEFLTEGPERQQ